MGQGEVTISESGDALHSPWYHIHPVDLRSLASLRDGDEKSDKTSRDILQRTVDTTLPTLLISECCLVYLPPDEADGVVHYFTDTLFSSSSSSSSSSNGTSLGLIVYEPIRPYDSFGRVMISNLSKRGIHMQTIRRYESLGAQRQRLRDQGFDRGQGASDIDFIWERWVSEEEKERVAGLEMLDEVEEWRLLARHYCVAWGWRGHDSDSSFDGWMDVEGQQGDREGLLTG